MHADNLKTPRANQPDAAPTIPSPLSPSDGRKAKAKRAQAHQVVGGGIAALGIAYLIWGQVGALILAGLMVFALLPIKHKC